MLDRLAEAEQMTPCRLSGAARRARAQRALLAALAAEFDGAVTLAAAGVAPVGLQSSGNAVFAVPSSYLGTPAISLPLISVGGLPVGFQAMGFAGRDAELIGWRAG